MLKKIKVEMKFSQNGGKTLNSFIPEEDEEKESTEMLDSVESFGLLWKVLL